MPPTSALSRLCSSLVLGCLLLAASTASGQGASEINGPPAPVAPASVARDANGRATLRAHRVREAMRTDGALDEAIYREIQPIGDFVQYEPVNGAPATEQTEVWILFDDENLYVSGRAHDRNPDKWVLNEMRRDIPNVSANESVGFSIDTFHDRRNGYLFEVNAIGGFLDAQISNESFPPNANWNAVWDAKVGRFDGGWTFEYRIPFRSIRYQPGADQVWGFNMRRVVRYKNEESHIVPLPPSLGQRRGLIQVSMSAPLVGVEVPSASRNIELRPFGITSVTTDRLARPAVSNDVKPNGGLDVKYGVTRNLTADFTANTDFAQVEVDEGQVNLTRFGLFYPEKRNFFLEGQGIFSFGVGAGQNTNGGDVPTLFFSRQIGLNNAQEVPIRAGGRLTGKAGAYSIGLLNIATGEKTSASAQPTDFTVVRLKRDLLRRSAVGIIYADRSHGIRTPDRGRTYGADAAFNFGNDLNLNAYVAQTDTPGLAGAHNSYRGQFNYAGDRYGLVAERLVIDEAFNPEVGFVRRPDMRKWTGTARFSPRPKKRGYIRKYLYETTGSYIENHTGVLETRQWDGTFGLDLNSGDSLRVQATQEFEFLARPFRIDRAATIRPGAYDFTNLAVRYTLGAQRRLAGTASVERGSFYGGDKTTVGFSAGRYNPTYQIQVQPGVSVNHVELPVGHFTATQLQTRVVYTLTPRTFVAALVQYNSSSRLVSTNARLRWEYTPGSELFVVYTDERDSTSRGFPGLNNRAFVVKIAPLLMF